MYCIGLIALHLGKIQQDNRHLVTNAGKWQASMRDQPSPPLNSSDTHQFHELWIHRSPARWALAFSFSGNLPLYLANKFPLSHTQRGDVTEHGSHAGG